jgi:hypothetical protein
MRKPSVVRASLAVMGCSVLVTTCGDPKTNPPTSPTPPRAVSVAINGPASVAPGQSAQFTADLRFDDGTTKSVISPNVSWRSSNTAVLQVNASGLATARPNTGDASLTAEVPSTISVSARTATREVVVVPDGTYRLVGVVADAELPTLPVVGALVEVTPGSLSTTTDATGRYKLYGVPAVSEIRITATGYLQLVQNLQLTTHTTQNFQLALPGPRLQLPGNYSLAIDVTGGCPGSRPLSTDLQHRRYDAVVTQNAQALTVTLTEPIFRLNSTSKGNRFTGQAGATGAVFTLEPYYSYYYAYYGPFGYPSVVERLSNGTFLVIEGKAVTTGSAAGFSGQLNGSISNYDSRFPTTANFLGGCFSSTLQFSLSPR